MANPLGKAIGWGVNQAKQLWPMAVPAAFNQLNQWWQSQSQPGAGAPGQAGQPGRTAIAKIPGASDVSNLRLNLKISEDRNMSKLVSVLDQYLEQKRAFEWGAETFCKQSGFDAEDMKAMLDLVKQAGLPGMLGRSRLRPRMGGAQSSPFANLALQPVPKSSYTPKPMVAPGAAGSNLSAVSQRMRDFTARRRRRELYSGGGGYRGAAGAGGAEAGGGEPQMQASGGPMPKPDGSWLPWAALLGGGYLAHGYGTEGGTYSMFDPEKIRNAKRARRDEAWGIKSPEDKAKETAKSPVSFEDDVAARNKTMMENYLKQLDLAGPDDPRTVAAGFYGGVAQPSNLNNFNYAMDQSPEFKARLEKRYGPEMSAAIINKLHSKTTGQTGSF